MSSHRFPAAAAASRTIRTISSLPVHSSSQPLRLSPRRMDTAAPWQVATYCWLAADGPPVPLRHWPSRCWRGARKCPRGAGGRDCKPGSGQPAGRSLFLWAPGLGAPLGVAQVAWRAEQWDGPEPGTVGPQLLLGEEPDVGTGAKAHGQTDPEECGKCSTESASQTHS